ncbi:DUF1752-domain-containing protein [Phlegmacium glaucopus]|nr:DUF1752-domain-containing protein [Phlegmacium glaucopus]
MLTAFPTPVLSITADAVRDLEGRDALSGLWNLFTKCKESLQDGRRLENISWRLWYRDMMRDDLSNRLYQEKEIEQLEQDQENVLSLQEKHTPANSHRCSTQSESESMPPPPYAIQDANDSTSSYQPSLISATTVLPQDHDHAS